MVSMNHASSLVFRVFNSDLCLVLGLRVSFSGDCEKTDPSFIDGSAKNWVGKVVWVDLFPFIKVVNYVVSLDLLKGLDVWPSSTFQSFLAWGIGLHFVGQGITSKPSGYLRNDTFEKMILYVNLRMEMSYVKDDEFGKGVLPLRSVRHTNEAATNGGQVFDGSSMRGSICSIGIMMNLRSIMYFVKPRDEELFFVLQNGVTNEFIMVVGVVLDPDWGMRGSQSPARTLLVAEGAMSGCCASLSEGHDWSQCGGIFDESSFWKEMGSFDWYLSKIQNVKLMGLLFFSTALFQCRPIPPRMGLFYVYVKRSGVKDAKLSKRGSFVYGIGVFVSFEDYATAMGIFLRRLVENGTSLTGSTLEHWLMTVIGLKEVKHMFAVCLLTMEILEKCRVQGLTVKEGRVADCRACDNGLCFTMLFSCIREGRSKNWICALGGSNLWEPSLVIFVECDVNLMAWFTSPRISLWLCAYKENEIWTHFTAGWPVFDIVQVVDSVIEAWCELCKWGLYWLEAEISFWWRRNVLLHKDVIMVDVFKVGLVRELWSTWTKNVFYCAFLGVVGSSVCGCKPLLTWTCMGTTIFEKEVVKHDGCHLGIFNQLGAGSPSNEKLAGGAFWEVDPHVDGCHMEQLVGKGQERTGGIGDEISMSRREGSTLSGQEVFSKHFRGAHVWAYHVLVLPMKKMLLTSLQCLDVDRVVTLLFVLGISLIVRFKLD